MSQYTPEFRHPCPQPGAWWVLPQLRTASETMLLFVPSLPAVRSVVKKDTMPTDVPKSTWPFSADSDSSWTSSEQPGGPVLGAALGHSWECVQLFHASIGAALAGAGRQARWVLFLRATSCQHPYRFAVISFLKGGHVFQSGPSGWHPVCQAATASCLGPCTPPSGGSGGKGLVLQQLCGGQPFPLGLLQHWGLVALEAAAGSRLLPPCPASEAVSVGGI